MAYSDPGAVTGGSTPARATWANAVRDDLVDHETRILAVESGSTGGIVSRQTSLTNAQIKALPTTGIQVVAPQGAGMVANPIAVFYRFKFSGGAYTNINTTYADLRIQWQSPAYAYAAGYIVNDNSTSPGLGDISSIFGNAQDRFVATAPLAGADSGYVVTSGQSIVVQTSGVSNQGLYVGMDNNGSGNLTGGNAANSLTVTILYAVVDAS